MQKYKIIVAYDGTDYFGWQAQKDLPTIVQVLQDRFFAVFGQRISLLGASRTDAGVHALGQVAQFDSDMKINPVTMLQAWNNMLPSAMVINSLEPVDSRFNPHCNIVQKTYHYHFFLERPQPLSQRYGWYFRYPVNIDKLKTGLQVFVGTHDFRSFCTGDDRKNTVRTIDAMSVEYIERLGSYRIMIRGPKFLHYMIRRMVGAALEVASRDYLLSDCLYKALEEKNPEQTFPKAPAKGLILHSIEYDGLKSNGILAKERAKVNQKIVSTRKEHEYKK